MISNKRSVMEGTALYPIVLSQIARNSSVSSRPRSRQQENPPREAPPPFNTYTFTSELNPGACLNRDVKAGFVERALPADAEEVDVAVVEHLSNGGATPRRCGICSKVRVCYAAAEE